jgi:outer membrane protein assembly factor BamB
LFVLLLASAGRAQDRPADNATAARIADGDEKVRAGKLLDAIEQFQRVLDTAGDELVPVDQSWYTPARWVVHGHLARLPADGVKLYRQRVDGQAAKRLIEAKNARDDAGLNRLLADMFCARASEEAILELARRAFERAEFDAAEHFWQMLLPPAADDNRLLHFLDAKTPPAAVRARLILVKLFRGDRDEAKTDFQAFREQFPNDAGLLAGQTGKYIDTLAALMNDPAQTTLPRPPDEPGWPTFAGSPARRGTNRAKLPYFWPDVPTWQKPLPFRPRAEPGKRRATPLGPAGAIPFHPTLAFYPVISGGRVYVVNGALVKSFGALTGDEDDRATGPAGGEESSVPVTHDVRFTLTEADDILYARIGPAALQAGAAKSVIVAFGPPPEKSNNRPELWQLEPPAAEGTFTTFEGTPAVRGGRLYAAFWRHSGAEAQAGIACYRIDDPTTAPELVWQRTVGKAGSEPNGETRYRHNLVTLSGPNVVYCTDGGTVIALDAATGRPAWEYRYPRNERPTLPRYRDLCPPLADGGRVYAAPADTDRLLCLDAATGRLIWEREGVEVIHLLGVARGRLIATFGGAVRGIRGLNLRTGADSGAGGWTIHDDGGEGTFGRGLVTEDVVVWPTRHGLRFLDPADGTPLRSPLPGPAPRIAGGLTLPTDRGGPFGNLCYADGVLVVTTATEIWGFASEANKLGDRRKAVQDDPADPAKHADLAQSLIDAGMFAEAEAEAAEAGAATGRLQSMLAERIAPGSPRRPGLPAASPDDHPPKAEGLLATGGGVSFVLDRAIVSISPGLWPMRIYPAPVGGTAGLYPAHASGRLALAQATSGRLLVWDRPGEPPRGYPWTSKPWPEPPVDVVGDRFLIPDDGSVVLFDAKAGKELARYSIPGPDSLTGELPRFRLHQNDVLVLIDRNHGVEIDRLRIDGLKRAWPGSPIFIGRTLDDVVFADDRFFTAADGMLAARGWNDGNPLWEVPLPDGKWKLTVAPQGVLAYPAEATLRQPGFDAVGEFRRAGRDAAALLRAAGRTYDVWADRELPVLVFDPGDGRLVQRLTFPAAGPAAGVAVTPKGVVVVTGKGSWTLTAKH